MCGRRKYKDILTKDFLIYEYIEKKNSICDIAAKTETSRQEISRHLKRYGIPSRSMPESRALALDRGKANGKGKIFRKVIYGDELFFRTWSPEMAYVLGVLYTDGNVFPGKKQQSRSYHDVYIPANITMAKNTRTAAESIEPHVLQRHHI